MERELAMEFVRVTEAAAIASARWMGRGDKEAADGAAVDAMRAVFDSVQIDGTIVIGEGEKDEAPMLYTGEKVGTAVPPLVDIAVDPLEGTNLVAKGSNGAISVLAIAEKGCLLHAPDLYMDKIAVGPAGRGIIDIDRPIYDNLSALAKAKGSRIRDLTVVILERDRHKKLIADVRTAGARVKLITDGDVAPSVAAALDDTGIDLVVGIGGAPEGVLAAAALCCLGGEMQGRLAPRDQKDVDAIKAMGIEDPARLLRMEDLVRGDDVIFAATGITEGDLLRGVRFSGEAVRTHSLVMRGKTGTMRFIEAIHQLKTKPVIKDYYAQWKKE